MFKDDIWTGLLLQAVDRREVKVCSVKLAHTKAVLLTLFYLLYGIHPALARIQNNNFPWSESWDDIQRDIEVFGNDTEYCIGSIVLTGERQYNRRWVLKHFLIINMTSELSDNTTDLTRKVNLRWNKNLISIAVCGHSVHYQHSRWLYFIFSSFSLRLISGRGGLTRTLCVGLIKRELLKYLSMWQHILMSDNF